MSKAIFTTKIGSAYDDLPETRYHFPRKYFNQVQKAVGDYIIYYEPRRSSIETSGSRGRQSYFAIARITAIVEDTNIPDHFYALMDSYLDFDQPVRFSENDFYYESALKKIDGTTNRGFFGWAVRPIPEKRIRSNLESGICSDRRRNLFATCDIHGVR